MEFPHALVEERVEARAIGEIDQLSELVKGFEQFLFGHLGGMILGIELLDFLASVEEGCVWMFP